MSTMVPLYGFGGGSGGSGAALTVNAPAGVTVTVSKDGKSKNKTANSSGIAVFKGLSTGEWTVTITDGEKTASKPVTIISDFNKTITFFSATIHVTYPAGSTCTATDGVTTLTAPDTSGTWDCVVPNAGTWTVSLDSGFAETVSIDANGDEQTVDKWYLYNNGDEHTSLTGGYEKVGSGSLTMESDYMKVSTTTGAAYAVNSIALAGFTKIIFDVTSRASGLKTYFVLSKTKSSSYRDAVVDTFVASPSVGTRYTTEIAVPDNDAYYVGCGRMSSGDSNTFYVHAIYAEV